MTPESQPAQKLAASVENMLNHIIEKVSPTDDLFGHVSRVMSALKEFQKVSDSPRTPQIVVKIEDMAVSKVFSNTPVEVVVMDDFTAEHNSEDSCEFDGTPVVPLFLQDEIIVAPEKVQQGFSLVEEVDFDQAVGMQPDCR